MRWIFLFFVLYSLSLSSQELPPITNFDAETYHAGHQNWMIDQDKNQQLYVANNSGLLTYNGEQWRLYEMPDANAMRSVKVIDSLIFTGSYMDFGFWNNDSDGTLKYTSLKAELNTEILDGEQFWHIEELDDYIIFQSLHRLFSYHKKTGDVITIPAENTISNLFKVAHKLYFQVAEKGLFSIENNQINQEISKQQIGTKSIVYIFRNKNRDIAVTRDNGLFDITDKQWKSISVNGYPLTTSFFTATLAQTDKLVLGSIGEGLYFLDLSSGEIQHILQPDILNNTVLDIYEDQDENIWCGLDHGVSLVEIASPFSIFKDFMGEIGTVYCSADYDNNLYLGTNQGLYKVDKNNKDFELVEGTSGQVWSLHKFGDKLFIGHDRGTFRLKGNQLKQIFNGSGTWQLKAYQNGFLQGHYNSISYFNDKESSAVNVLEGFELSSRNMVVDSIKNEIWVGHDHKGIFKISLDPKSLNIIDVKNFKVDYKNKSRLSVFKFQNEIYYATEAAIYKFLPEQKSFSSKNKLNLLFGDSRSGIPTVTPDGTFWSFSGDKLVFTSYDMFQKKINLKFIPFPAELRSIPNGFENVSKIRDNQYLIGSNQGYTTIKLPVKTKKQRVVTINRVEIAKKEKEFASIPLKGAEFLEFKNDYNFINFYFSIPVYSKLKAIKYSYRLKGFSNEWSPFFTSNKTSFENLPFGEYEFQVKARNYNNDISKASFSFSIERPWYLSNLAFIFYFLLLTCILILTNHFYSIYYKKHQNKLLREEQKKAEIQQLESQQEIITLKNQRLEQDMSAKNRELAASTMSIIKKNEMLIAIKNELSTVSKLSDIKKVLTTINNNINQEDNWNLFKEAFDNADKNFLQAVKAKHPNLTSNDLKLCAYLRLNLSSKEIAPLLNISVRSVEIKRYRLRKKMDLTHGEGLVEYILEF
ncbi:triple tyrosine motif-containing protein [Zunongwangia sp.]|uniref:triple tyrosine motif-containing protein n=1 Tax=Zunongwangia sp. TaxID=1965325 RepID=UPI003AA9A652